MNTTPLEQLLEVAMGKRSLTLGLPASTSPYECRFPLTPEGVAMLTARGIDIRMETGAGEIIHYPDIRYMQAGASIVSRAETLNCDIVLHLPPIAAADARKMRRGSMLLSLFNPTRQDADAIRLLLERRIIAMALDLITDRAGNTPFADILNEIDGRAAIALAASLLADSKHGKGILLGGVAGIIPCEVTVIGAGIAGIAASRSALGLGAMVRMFDTDVYRLRSAVRDLGPGIAGSAMHPRVLLSALKTADIVVASQINPPHIIGPEAVAEMKRGVIVFSLDENPGAIFPSLPAVDLASAKANDNDMSGRRVCYINAAGAVPRTTAMALSNTIATMFTDIVQCGGTVSNALKLHPGMQRAVYTFMGRPVNMTIARLIGAKPVDINFLLSFS